MIRILISCLCLLLASSTFALQKLTVALDWFPNPDHAPLIIAKQQGYFKEQGLDVELIGPADPSDPPKWVAAHKADIGISYEPQFMELIERGLPIITIGTLINKPLNCLTTLQTSHITSLTDLKGKRIGTSSGLSGVLLRVMLKNHGVNESDVEFINVHYNLTQALLSHQVDAVTGLMRNVEIPALALNKQKTTVFFPEDNGIPTYSELIFITHLDNTQDDRLKRFLMAVKKGAAYLRAHPDAAWNDFAKAYPESNNRVNHASWFATIPVFTVDPADINKNEWEQFAQFMLQHQLIKKSQPVSRYIFVIKD